MLIFLSHTKHLRQSNAVFLYFIFALPLRRSELTIDIKPKNKQKVNEKYHFDQNFVSVPWQGPTDSLGISIAGGVGSPLGDVPIFIAMMHPTGVAAQTQKLRVSHTNNPRSPSKMCRSVFINL